MKHCILVTLALFCALSGTAHSQQLISKAANADVLAEVRQEVVLTLTGQTNFGPFGNSAHTETIDPRAPTANQSTAMFAVSNPSGGAIGFQCPDEITLTEPVSSAVMTFTSQFSANLSGPDQASSGVVGPVCDTGGSGLSQVWLWLGGSLAVGSGQAAGNYSGVYTLTVLH